MLRLGPKKSLLSLRLELMFQDMAQHTDDQSQVWYHSAIQTPQHLSKYDFSRIGLQCWLKQWLLLQFYTDFDEAFVTQTLFQWNPMLHLREFDLPEASNLSLVAVNVIIHVSNYQCDQMAIVQYLAI